MDVTVAIINNNTYEKTVDGILIFIFTSFCTFTILTTQTIKKLIDVEIAAPITPIFLISI